MSEEDRTATYRIVIEQSAPGRVYRVECKFLDIGLMVRWNDEQEDVRDDIRALLKDSQKVIDNCFNEIDVDHAARGLDDELAALFEPEPEEDA
jgi:hypothetical protein